MVPRTRFRALSLDLGETTWWDTPRHGVLHDTARALALSAICVDPQGHPFGSDRIREAIAQYRLELRRTDRPQGSVSTPHMIQELGRRLDGRLTVPLNEAVGRVAKAGLDTSPPVINPEAIQLVARLNRRQIPVVAISNTQRTGEAWRSFLGDAGMRFDFVVSSSDREVLKPDPRLFHAASDRLGIEAPQILHVGDRWTTDVAGALSVGMGAALYRGLWSHIWDGDVPTDPGTHPEVFRWDHLDQAEQYLGPGPSDPA